ncbi:A24 family peptidase [Amycolatopsis sp. NPDC049253]|uniref:A24 family peptidase n=1 Tax=Amycolatopsis sp. NPDC049253 TaxID=3155274 RepID=UPI0034394EFE
MAQAGGDGVAAQAVRAARSGESRRFSARVVHSRQTRLGVVAGRCERGCMSWGMVVAGGAVVLLLVWLLRRAGAPVSPVVAVAVVVAALLVVGWRWREGRWAEWWWPVPWVLTVVGVPLGLADVRHRRLPDVVTLPAYPAMATALTVAAVSGGGVTLLAGAAAGVLVFGGVHLVVHRVEPARLGAGDVKLAGVLGAVLGALGWASVAVAAVVAAGLSAVVAVGAQVRAIARRARRAEPASGRPASAAPSEGGSRAGGRPASAGEPNRTFRPASAATSEGGSRAGGGSASAGEPNDVLRPASAASPNGGSRAGGRPASVTAGTSSPPRDGPCPHRAIRCGVPHGPALVVAAWMCAVFPGLGSGVVPS